MKKRLLLVTEGFPFGESERSFLSEEVRHLAEAFDLSVLALDNGEELKYPVAGLQRVERYHFPAFRRSLGFGMLPELLHPSVWSEVAACCRKNGFGTMAASAKEIIYFRYKAWVAKKKIRELVKSEQIDLVYTYWCTAPTLAAVDLKQEFPQLKVITRFHGMDLYEERSSINWQPFRRHIAAGADGLCFACSYGLTYFAKRWGKECGDKLHLYYLGSRDYGMADTPKTEPLRLLSCSNLIPLKRVERIIEGIALLPEDMKLHWDMVGDGPEREKLEALAQEKFRDRPNMTWKFHGAIPNAQLAAHYHTLAPQLFITASSTEGGAPVSIQEVFSMGIPAIGTEVGGIPDLICDGQTGFLMPQDAIPSDVAAAICRFTALNDVQYGQMRRAARQHWERNFNAVCNAERFTNDLLDLVSK